jgi:hypothetical protein
MKTIILSIGLIAASLGMYAQNATLALKLNKGDKFALAQTNKIVIVMEVQGQQINTDVNSSTGQLIEVKDIINDNYILAVTNDGIIGKVSAMGSDMEFNTAKGEGSIVGQEFPSFVKSAAGFKYELVVNGKGELLSAKGLETLPKVSEDELGKINMVGGSGILNVTDSGMIKLTLSAFNYANKGAVKVGDSWTESIVVGKNTQSFKSDITSVNSNSVVVNKTGTNKVEGKMNSPMGEMDVSSTIDSKFAITIDASSGINKINKRTDSAKSIINANAGGMEMTSTTLTELDLTVTKQ